MSKAILKISYSCDNNCVFCHAQDSKNISNDFSKSIVQKILQIKSKFPDVDTILFSGGEPTVNLKLKSYMELSIKLGFKVGLITNGSGLDNDYIKEYIRNGDLNYIYLSLHSGNPKTHNYIAGNPNSFHNVLNFLKYSGEYNNLRIIINCVISRKNIDGIDDMVEFISGFNNVSLLKFSLLEPKGLGLSDLDELYVLLDESAEKIRRLMIEKKGDKIAWDGYPLCLYKGFEDRLSNLRTEDIKYMSEAFEGEIFHTDDSKRSYMEECENCRKKLSCPGIYYGYSQKFNGNQLKPY